MLGTLDMDLVELLFQRAKQALDSSVLPRAVQINALMADVAGLQTLAEAGASEAAFVVCADAFGFSLLGNGAFQMIGQ